VLQTLDSHESYRSSEPAFGEDHGQGLNVDLYIDILKRRFFYFLLPFGLISILGLYVAAIQKPNYLSQGKILVQSQAIASDIVTPVITATASERAQLIQQRITTRDNLLSIAKRFGLFPHASDASEILDSMLKSTQIKPVPVEIDGVLRPNSRTVAFTVGFEYENPELAMRVANELVTLIVSSDERSRTSRATEMVKLLTGQTKDIEDKLESTQMQIWEIARRPRDTTSEIPEGQKSQLTALAALRAELIQKSSVYSDAHPIVTALKKRIAAMEKSLAQPSQVSAPTQSTPDDIEALKRQREVLEKRLADANGKLASARLSEKLGQEQQSDHMQVIEAPSLPQKPVKSKKILIVGLAFAAAAILGIGAAIGPELLNGPIRSRHQLLGVVASPLIVSVPYITTRADIIRTRWRIIFGVVSVVILLAAWGGLTAAVVLHLPLDFSWFDKAGIGFRAAGQ
jgi:uncharacterized protein involved in exopolysaccharide biosynthesis